MLCHRIPPRRGCTLFALIVAALGLLTPGNHLNAQLCTGTSPPCQLTAGYAGPATDANFNSRQGTNPYETTFSPASVPGSTTAALFLQVDTNDLPSGAISNPIMAQPLYVAGITVSSPAQGTCSPCNMVIAVTLNGTVFAWRADGTGAGNLLWSRQGTTTNAYGGHALWFDDCNVGGSPVPHSDVLPFDGALSTPVIDASGSTPVMFLTSACQDTTPTPQWWLHEIDLKTGKDVVIGTTTQKRHIGGISGDFSGIKEAWQQQRPALLQVKNSGNTTTTNLIYVLFGTAVLENVYLQDYKGWVAAYQNTASGLQAVFSYTNEFSSCGTGGGVTISGTNNGQCTGNSGSPSCDCYVSTTPATPNWGGHGGGAGCPATARRQARPALLTATITCMSSKSHPMTPSPSRRRY